MLKWDLFMGFIHFFDKFFAALSFFGNPLYVYLLKIKKIGYKSHQFQKSNINLRNDNNYKSPCVVKNV